jgi:MoxR-like ATPase
MDGGLKRPKLVESYVAWGAGPRASEYLVLAAKAKAILSGSPHATPEHVRAIIKPVLRHRIMMNFNAEADQVTADAIIENLVKETPVDSESPAEKKALSAVM